MPGHHRLCDLLTERLSLGVRLLRGQPGEGQPFNDLSKSVCATWFANPFLLPGDAGSSLHLARNLGMPGAAPHVAF